MANIGKRPAAVFLAAAMVVTFVFILKTQKAYADEYVSFSTEDGLVYGQDESHFA